MQIETGYLYHIKDEFFDKVNEKEGYKNEKTGNERLTQSAIFAL